MPSALNARHGCMSVTDFLNVYACERDVVHNKRKNTPRS